MLMKKADLWFRLTDAEAAMKLVKRETREKVNIEIVSDSIFQKGELHRPERKLGVCRRKLEDCRDDKLARKIFAKKLAKVVGD